jgi:hypothetical protein
MNDDRNIFPAALRQVVLATWVDDDGRFRFLVVRGHARSPEAIRDGSYVSILCENEGQAIELAQSAGFESAAILPFEPIGCAADRVVSKLRGRRP